jgi:hypothetical protein
MTVGGCGRAKVLDWSELKPVHAASDQDSPVSLRIELRSGETMFIQ